MAYCAPAWSLRTSRVVAGSRTDVLGGGGGGCGNAVTAATSANWARAVGLAYRVERDDSAQMWIIIIIRPPRINSLFRVTRPTVFFHPTASYFFIVHANDYDSYLTLDIDLMASCSEAAK